MEENCGIKYRLSFSLFQHEKKETERARLDLMDGPLSNSREVKACPGKHSSPVKAMRSGYIPKCTPHHGRTT